ncbi:hypothetical protein BaRGS_00035345 [Batillaria attramentaria]|uniref:Uncharacterized protein n=1 Tax=Batillaria attramentaria TaxID=370345 RepID=A0ABD0JF26_9CAEN
MAMANRVPKVVTVGSISTGKTSLVRRYLVGDFKPVPATVGYVPTIVKARPDCKDHLLPEVKFELIDTAGSERYGALAPSYLRGAVVVMLVYDVNDTMSFDAVQHRWKEEVRVHAPDAHVILVGTKQDAAPCGRQVITERAANFAADSGYTFFETSAKTGTNVRQLFRAVVNILSRAGRHLELSDSIVLERVRKPEKAAPDKKCRCS